MTMEGSGPFTEADLAEYRALNGMGPATDSATTDPDNQGKGQITMADLSAQILEFGRQMQQNQSATDARLNAFEARIQGTSEAIKDVPSVVSEVVTGQSEGRTPEEIQQRVDARQSVIDQRSQQATEVARLKMWFSDVGEFLKEGTPENYAEIPEYKGMIDARMDADRLLAGDGSMMDVMTSAFRAVTEKVSAERTLAEARHQAALEEAQKNARESAISEFRPDDQNVPGEVRPPTDASLLGRIRDVSKQENMHKPIPDDLKTEVMGYLGTI